MVFSFPGAATDGREPFAVCWRREGGKGVRWMDEIEREAQHKTYTAVCTVHARKSARLYPGMYHPSITHQTRARITSVSQFATRSTKGTERHLLVV